MSAAAQIGVIGGTGLYQVEGVKVLTEVRPETPWGPPSDAIAICDVAGIPVAFLPRHGRGHRILPTEVNSHANIAALKSVGVRQIVAFSAVGSLKEEITPLDFVVPDQLIDRTRTRKNTYFGDGVVAHVGFADPFCPRLRQLLLADVQSAGVKVHAKATLVCMEGPAFSTKAESHLYRSWGGSCINMSALPEAKLAREAELCYAMVCMSTDYDCWREETEHVSAEMIFQNLAKNAASAARVIRAVPRSVAASRRECGCGTAARHGIITAPEARPRETAQRLKYIHPDLF